MEDKFFFFDFCSYVCLKLADYSRNKMYKSEGSPSIRGWNVYPKLHGKEVENLIKSLNINPDPNKNFPENYKIFRVKIIKEFNRIVNEKLDDGRITQNYMVKK